MRHRSIHLLPERVATKGYRKKNEWEGDDDARDLALFYSGEINHPAAVRASKLEYPAEFAIARMCGASILEYDAGLIPEHRIAEAQILLAARRKARASRLNGAGVMPTINVDPLVEM